MKTLLLNIRTYLRDTVNCVRNNSKDIYIAPHIDFLPAHVKFPCIGIKDGDVDPSFGAGCIDRDLIVYVSLYTNLYKFESNLIGDDSANKIGILDFSDRVRDLLNVYIPTNCQAVECIKESGSELLTDGENSFIQQKILTFKYFFTY